MIKKPANYNVGEGKETDRPRIISSLIDTNIAASALIVPSAGSDNEVMSNKDNSADATVSQTNNNFSMVSLSIPSRIKPIWGLDETSTYTTRKSAVHALGGRLNRDEIESLYAFLLSNIDDPLRQQDSLAFYSIKNDVMAVLVQQTTMPFDLHDIFIKIAQDSEADEILRDYAIQHFYHGIKRLKTWSDPVLANSAQAQLTQAYLDLASNSESSLSGTSLLGLRMLQQEGYAVDSLRVEELVTSMVTGKNVNVATRLTALGVCSIYIDEDMKLAISRLATSSEAAPIREAASRVLSNIEKQTDTHR